MASAAGLASMGRLERENEVSRDSFKARCWLKGQNIALDLDNGSNVGCPFRSGHGGSRIEDADDTCFMTVTRLGIGRLDAG